MFVATLVRCHITVVSAQDLTEAYTFAPHETFNCATLNTFLLDKILPTSARLGWCLWSWPARPVSRDSSAGSVASETAEQGGRRAHQLRFQALQDGEQDRRGL